GLGCDVIHFPFQSFEPCGLPSVYNPHDLQHLHHPEFFTPPVIARRESLYTAACRAAHTVVVASQFVKRDIVERYRIASEKVQVIPWAPPPPESARAARADDFPVLRKKYGFGDRPFALYPAMTWEHKNHVRLLEAVAHLRDRSALELHIVCTGHKTDFWPRIKRRTSELGLEGQVKFLGLVPAGELSTLYRAAQFVFIPTLFEAVSGPVFEAWQHGAPVACSSVTSLPEQAAGAALLFDPLSVEGIADALARMATDTDLRDELSTGAGANAANAVTGTTPPAAGGAAARPGATPAGGSRTASSAAPANVPKPQIGSGGNDLYLFTRARGVIGTDAELKAANIVVEVKDGVATLSGTVASDAQKSKAEQLTLGVGVKTVKNQLRVSAGK
ncbi:MAG: glycosyltransferase, partial [Acidobacteria bacterium]|nr:glycosyltransferase [Acidobacteriota bacterium]